MTLLNLNDFQSEVHEWEVKNFGEQSGWMPLLGVGEEVGELQHAYLKMTQGIRGSLPEHVANMKDAVGDIVIFLAAFCALMGIDMEMAIVETWGEVKKRDWTANKVDGRTDAGLME